jgi:hypothetical protein
MILAGGQRREFFAKELKYLFSHDVKLESDGLGFFPGGLLLETRGARNDLQADRGDLNENPSRAFHVKGDNVVLGNDAIEGAVVWFSERIFLVEGNDAGRIEARLTLRTFDDALIWAHYEGRLRLGRMGYRRFLTGRSGYEEKELSAAEVLSLSNFEAKAFVTPRFETNSSKYRWITERQCVGYGRVIVQDGAFRAAKYDVYSTT